MERADDDLADGPVGWRKTLSEQGGGHLVEEFDATTDAGRKARLGSFIRLCFPDSKVRTAEDRFVRLASEADLVASGRVSDLSVGSPYAFELLGQPVPEAPVQVIDLRHATILSNQTVLVDELYLTDQVRHMHGNWLGVGEGYYLDYLESINLAEQGGRVRVPKGCVALPDSSVYFLFQSVVGSLSFGHFVLDMLVQLIVYDQLRMRYGAIVTPIIVSEVPKVFRWPGMYWLFEGLVGPVKDVVHIQPETRVSVSRVFTTNRLTHLGAGGVSTVAFRHLRERIFGVFAPSEQAKPRHRIYVSRKDAGYREASNIADVEVLLADLGFHTVVVEELSPQEAFDAFYYAEIVVGMHGSGLMYHLYMASPGMVIELSYPGYVWPVILACAAACGHEPVRIAHIEKAVDLEELRAVLMSGKAKWNSGPGDAD